MRVKMIEGFRLSLQQEHLWSLQQADDAPSYRVQCAVLIEGQFDVCVFEAAVRSVVARHEIFRTSFGCSPESSIPLQVVNESSALRIATHDLSMRESNEQTARLESLFQVDGELPFKCDESPLLHLSLATLSADKQMLFVTSSAFCADARTLNIFVSEVSRFYSACLRGEAIAPAALQYADVAQWNYELLESPDANAGREYWRKKHTSAAPRLALPFEDRRSGRPGFDPRSLIFAIRPALTAALNAVVRRYDTSTSALLLACWQTLLWRLTGQSRFVVAISCDGRIYDELQETPGPLTQSVPLRCDLEERLHFSELLKQVTQSTHEAAEWQEWFSRDLVGVANIDPEADPYFPVIFEFDDLPLQFAAEDIKFTIHRQHACTERFEIKLSCVQSADVLSLELHYDSSLVRAEDIARLTEEFQTLLASITSNPEAPLGDLEVLGEFERARLLDEFNDVGTSVRIDKCIHQLFEEQVKRAPNNVAVVSTDQRLTYAQLNARANQLAHYLQSLGVGPEVPVAICMERCLEMVVGVLGILKAGGSYVPLDPAYPKERLAFMMADSRAPVLLTRERSAVAGNANPGIRVVCLESDWTAIARESEEDPPCKASGRNPAYVIFTSGSTGQPKGVIVEHAGLVNAVNWLTETLELTAGDRCLLKTPITFDAAGRELFPILLVGGSLVIAEADGHRDCHYIAETLRNESISVLHCVPSFLRLVIEESAFEAKLGLRAVMCGGEALPPRVVERFHERSKAKLYNVYGPTETIIDSAYGLCKSDSVDSTTSIGRPIPNALLYIVDEALHLVPIGVAGQLYIGGVGLARGYLNRPDLTAEKFIPDPFSTKPGARLYHTGDLARHLPDGRIEFLGRSDHQIKVRGFRIELGEIEAALNEHPALLESIVVAEEDSSAEKRMVAYVVANQPHPLNPGELRSFLRGKLPEHMVPAAFVPLDALPLLPNGKVNRRALPAFDRTRPAHEQLFVAARTPTEELVAQVFAQVLQIDRVGIHDNFFDLGGHSLLATQAVSRMREAFAMEIPLRRLFEVPTVAGLAESIEVARQIGQKLQAPPILRVPRDRELPLSFAQQRLWFIDQLDSGNSVYNFPAAVRLKGHLNIVALERTVDEIVSRHEALRTTFPTVDGRPTQLIAPTLRIVLPIVNLNELSENERETRVQQLAIEEARRPFNLTVGPLIRVTLLRLTEEEHVGLLTMHHIVSDGWSTGILIREMAILYESFCSGRPSPLTELPIQYADFAHWQRQWLQGEVLEVQLNYWKRQLLGASLLEMPSDHPRPAVQTFRGAHKSLRLPNNVSEGLKALSRRTGITLFMTLLTAFNVLLRRYTGQDDVIIGTPIANRNRLEIEGLIGFFVNTLVIRTDLSGNPTFSKLALRVREVCLEAYAHQDLPFERLVEELHLKRNLARNPLFQVMFVLQSAAPQEIGLPGLTLSPVEIEIGTSHFDLILHVSDTAEGLTATVTYNSDLFEVATITRMLNHFGILLEAVVINPDTTVSDLPLLSETEGRQLLVEWNQTKTDTPDERCVHQLFEAQVERTPDAIAIAYDGGFLTYAELNRRSNQIAYYLRSLGIAPEIPVGICLEPSSDMIIGLLGILKSGAVYLPLDPACPKERLAYMLDKARASVILTRERLIAALPRCDAKIVCLDSARETIAREREENPINSTGSENLAYIIFTSGSTGQPKGVAVSHGSIAGHCRHVQEYYELRANDRVLQFASMSFDLSLEQILPTLIVGARLVMMGMDVWNTAEFNRKIAEFGLTVLSLTTGYWLELAREWAENPELCSSLPLRLVTVGGDIMSPEGLTLWRRTPANAVRLLNAYGPTEAAITATAFEIGSQRCQGTTSQRIPIGQPLGTRETYILDTSGNPVPIGVPGELHIGGTCLARGYLDQPDLTAEKFIPNPFSSEPGKRLYKTGDLARYLDDGNIDFLGRVDHQVKIRGFRVELGEIEIALSRHPAVRDAVVLAQEDTPGERRLVAYVVGEKGLIASSNELRAFLLLKLPEYMLPASYVPLDELPLMMNGKVDRRALPEIGLARLGTDDALVMPRDAMELQLAQLWEEVLSVGPVGVRDNFFELGGHSLAAVRLFALIEHRMGKRLPLSAVFQGATIEQLAILLRQQDNPTTQTSLVTMQPHGDRRPLFMIHPAGGQVFPYVHLARALGLQQPFYALQARGLEPGQDPHARIEDMATHYIDALQRVQPEGPYFLGGWSMGGTIAFEMARQLHAQDEKVLLLALLDSRIPSQDEKSTEDEFETTLLRDVVRYFGLPLDPQILSRLSKDEALAQLLEQAKKAGLVPWELEVSQAHRFVDLCKADFRATRNYVLHRYPGQITLFKAAEDPAGTSTDATLGWGEWAAGGVEVHVVPGNHANMVYTPNVEILAEKLKICLGRVQPSQIEAQLESIHGLA
jgi:amino acid adenylation domain-containing protein